MWLSENGRSGNMSEPRLNENIWIEEFLSLFAKFRSRFIAHVRKKNLLSADITTEDMLTELILASERSIRSSRGSALARIILAYVNRGEDVATSTTQPNLNRSPSKESSEAEDKESVDKKHIDSFVENWYSDAVDADKKQLHETIQTSTGQQIDELCLLLEMLRDNRDG